MLSHVFCQASRAALRCGAAKVNNTPPVGTWQAGWANRNKPCDNIADELYAKTLIFDDGSNTIAFVSLDLLTKEQISLAPKHMAELWNEISKVVEIDKKDLPNFSLVRAKAGGVLGVTM